MLPLGVRVLLVGAARLGGGGGFVVELRKAQGSQLGQHLRVESGIEVLRVSRENKESGEKRIGDDGVLIKVVLHRAQCKNPIRRIRQATEEGDLELAGLGAVWAIGIAEDLIERAVHPTNAGRVVNRNGAVWEETVLSSDAERVLLKSLVDYKVGVHLIPCSEVLGDIQ